MTLDQTQKQSLYDNGYVIAPSLVPTELVRAAKREINRSLGRGIDPERITEFEHQSFCPELRDSPIIWDLLRNEHVKETVEELVGPNSIDPQNIRPQMAIRFPLMDDDVSEVFPHIDGMPTPTNGLPPGDIWSHTMLVGVFLSDIVEENSGNFTAWPGSHHLYETYFRDNGPQALLEGMPAIDIGKPEQLMAKAGDVLIAHYEVGHTVGFHIGPDVRYTVFFRIRHENHENQKWDAMTNIWMEWPGMTQTVEAAK